ncbi:hypothetical protein E3N88_10300 [Mikania micrantha]|uniref:Protein kinase domain-containing protein n=1 Tax=Mikania micrantha TaxID=192012 RepID=A0A5N6PBD5_9ASTR|nr:hypothetical protein E3N88_10300 [Mikania micrantha]
MLNQTRFSYGVSVGNNYVCGFSGLGQIRCSGDNFNFTKNGNHSVISAGYDRVCAINSSNGIDCWEKAVSWKPDGVFKSVSVGVNRSCAIRFNGTVICWGENNFKLPENLQQVSFEDLQVNLGVFCGVSTLKYSLYCWGNEALSLNSNLIVGENVVPGLCTTTCACGTIPNCGAFCSQGLLICRPCFIQPQPMPEPTPPYLSPFPPPQNGGWSGKMIAFVVVGSVGCLSFVLVICFVIFRFCKSSGGSRVHDSGPMEDAQIASQIQSTNRILVKKLSHLISMGNGSHLEEFTLQTILNATDNFSDDHRIGIGGFGSVYQGSLPDGRRVAVKRAELTSSSSYPGVTKRQEDTNNAFVNELEFLSRVNHKNLVRLLGFCEEETELVLVYEFMPNGSLHIHLHSLYSAYIMSWAARIKVALDAARGIEYLHNEMGEKRNVVDSVVPYIVNDEIHRILDPKVPPPTPFEIEAVKYVGYLAVDCVTMEGKYRPTMSELVMCLEKALCACLTIQSFSHSSSASS